MKKAIIFALIAFVIAFITSMMAVDYISEPATCTGCHEITNHNSSFYDVHTTSQINCIDCHSGKGVQAYVEARTELLNAVLLKSSASFFNQNISASFNHANVQANCTKCHARVNSPYFNHSAAANCTRCHNISGLQELSGEGFWKKMGAGGHRNKTCEDCHTTGFQIPACTQCHTTHIEGANWNNRACLACHNSPHIPVLNGVFEKGIPKVNCGACHKDVYDNLEFYNSRHNQLGSCVNCHPAHGEIKKCFSCHTLDHRSHPFAGENCAGCHGKASCKDCHRQGHAPFMGVPKIASKEQFNDYASSHRTG